MECPSINVSDYVEKTIVGKPADQVRESGYHQLHRGITYSKGFRSRTRRHTLSENVYNFDIPNSAVRGSYKVLKVYVVCFMHHFT